MKNKNDVQDVLMDTKVDGNRIYQPVTHTRRIFLKSFRDKLAKKYTKLCYIINMKALQQDDYIKCVMSKIE